MSCLDGLEIGRYRARNLDVAGAERLSAERGVENIIFALKVRGARVFASVLFPRLFGDDKLPAVLEVLAVNRERFADGREASRRHERVWAAQRAIQQMRDVALFDG